MSAPALFNQEQVWGHYIGKSTYPSDASFLDEARRIGVSRRVPARIARAMNFGDRVILLRWLGNGRARAFAEMQITGLTLSEDIAARVAEELGDRVRCSGDDRPVHHQRGCGMYTVTTTCVVIGVTLAEIIDIALRISPKPFVMLQGRITRVIEPPEEWDGMRFTRGFFRIERRELIFTEAQQDHGVVSGIRDYTRETAPQAPKLALNVT